VSSAPIRLIEPTAELGTEFLSMIDDYRAAGEERYQHLRALVVHDFTEYIHRIEAASRSVGLEPGAVPQTTFWLVRGNTIVGTSRLRHYLTPDLEREGGHIGYDVRPAERKKGYGTLLLALTLEKARELGPRRVLVTCDTDNVGSARMIEKNGGRLENEEISPESGKLVSRYWIDC
jgi:predicted acetyltransferase